MSAEAVADASEAAVVTGEAAVVKAVAPTEGPRLARRSEQQEARYRREGER
ncbi:MAG: hypothetical protein INR63_23305 [Actinomycetospora chiangmaiensis]|nr:hypothetical protein [Actinomycetospora chiangmaiensis]